MNNVLTVDKNIITRQLEARKKLVDATPELVSHIMTNDEFEKYKIDFGELVKSKQYGLTNANSFNPN